METLKAMATRKSVREFTDEGITFEDIKKILTAGMSGPSCMNKRMWSFVVIRNKELLGKLSVANGLYAGPLRGAALGILVCGDLERALPEAPEYWVIDASIATQNMVLAAQDLGIGSVWLGCWPCEDRVQEVVDDDGVLRVYDVRGHHAEHLQLLVAEGELSHHACCLLT